MLKNIDKAGGPAVFVLVALLCICCIMGIISFIGSEKNKKTFRVLFSQSVLFLSLGLMFYLKQILTRFLLELNFVMIVFMLVNAFTGMRFLREPNEENSIFLGRYLSYTTLILYTIDAILFFGFVIR